MADSLGLRRGVPSPYAAASASRVTFPQSIEEFNRDDRVSFDKSSDKYILEDNDGSEWEWNDSIEKWVPLV